MTKEEKALVETVTLLSLLLSNIEKLEENRIYNKSLKHRGNMFRNESEKLLNKIWEKFTDKGKQKHTEKLTQIEQAFDEAVELYSEE